VLFDFLGIEHPPEREQVNVRADPAYL